MTWHGCQWDKKHFLIVMQIGVFVQQQQYTLRWDELRLMWMKGTHSWQSLHTHRVTAHSRCEQPGRWAVFKHQVCLDHSFYHTLKGRSTPLSACWSFLPPMICTSMVSVLWAGAATCVETCLWSWNSELISQSVEWQKGQCWSFSSKNVEHSLVLTSELRGISASLCFIQF